MVVPTLKWTHWWYHIAALPASVPIKSNSINKIKWRNNKHMKLNIFRRNIYVCVVERVLVPMFTQFGNILPSSRVWLANTSWSTHTRGTHACDYFTRFYNKQVKKKKKTRNKERPTTLASSNKIIFENRIKLNKQNAQDRAISNGQHRRRDDTRALCRRVNGGAHLDASYALFLFK